MQVVLSHMEHVAMCQLMAGNNLNTCFSETLYEMLGVCESCCQFLIRWRYLPNHGNSKAAWKTLHRSNEHILHILVQNEGFKNNGIYFQR